MQILKFKFWIKSCTYGLSYLSLKKQNTNIDTYVKTKTDITTFIIGVIFSREQDVQQENVIDKRR